MKTLYQDGNFAFFASTIEDGDFAVPQRLPMETRDAFYSRPGPDGGWTYFLRMRNVIRRGVPSIVLPYKGEDGKQATMPRQFGTTHIVQAAHGDKIAAVGPIPLDREQELYENNVNGGPVYHVDTDGLLTDQSLCVLAVTGADCPPVLIMDPVKKAIALVHSGRKGTALNIVGKAVRSLSLKTGTPSSKMWAIIGPGISCHNYEVNGDIAFEFRDRAYHTAIWSAKVGGEWKHHLDLKTTIAHQLESAGLVVSVSDLVAGSECTYDNPETWHSFRRDTHQGLSLDRPRVQVFCATILT